ncbi:MAG: hypothetical protein QXK49_03690 [Candidatus Aenigmatarchaeota archaeon]
MKKVRKRIKINTGTKIHVPKIYKKPKYKIDWKKEIEDDDFLKRNNIDEV